MMNLSKTVGYAVHALSCLDQANGQPLFVQDIADRTGLRKPYLARIVNRLVHHGLIVSKRGYRGGIVLACPARQVPLLRIVEALDGRNWSRSCFFGLEACPASRLCPAHKVWNEARQRLAETLQATTLADLSEATRPNSSPPKPSLLAGAGPVPARSLPKPLQHASLLAPAKHAVRRA